MPLSQLFWSVATIKIKVCSYLQNAIKLVSENSRNIYFVLFLLEIVSIKQRIKRINKSQILDFIAFYKMPQLFWNWGCK